MSCSGHKDSVYGLLNVLEEPKLVDDADGIYDWDLSRISVLVMMSPTPEKYIFS